MSGVKLLLAACCILTGVHSQEQQCLSVLSTAFRGLEAFPHAASEDDEVSLLQLHQGQLRTGHVASKTAQPAEIDEQDNRNDGILPELGPTAATVEDEFATIVSPSKSVKTEATTDNLENGKSKFDIFEELAPNMAQNHALSAQDLHRLKSLHNASSHHTQGGAMGWIADGMQMSKEFITTLWLEVHRGLWFWLLVAALLAATVGMVYCVRFMYSFQYNEYDDGVPIPRHMSGTLVHRGGIPRHWMAAAAVSGSKQADKAEAVNRL